MFVSKWSVIGLLALCAGCELEPEQSAPSDPLLDPNSAATETRLNAINGSRIYARCNQYNFRELANGSLSFILSDAPDAQLWYVDQFGDKKHTQPHSISTERRSFGKENILVECQHEKYGIHSFFHPKLGVADGGIFSDYPEPPLWTLFGNFSYGGDERIVVSPYTETVYQVYKKLARKYASENGDLPDSKVSELYIEATEMVDALGAMKPESFTNVGAEVVQGPVNTRDERHTERMTQQAIINQRFEFQLRTEPGFDSSMANISELIAKQLVDGPDHSKLGRYVAVAYDLDSNQRDVTLNGNFAQGIESWTLYDQINTLSESSHYFTDSQNGKELNLSVLSTRESNDRPVQIGVYQGFPVLGADLTDYYLTAVISEIAGKNETGGLNIGAEDGSGASTISLEYVGSANEVLGTTHFINTEDSRFAGIDFLYNTPIALASQEGNIIVRLPSLPNKSLIANVGDFAKLTLGNDISRIASVRIYAVAGDYISGQDLYHYSGALLVRSNCNECPASLIVDELEVVYLD